MEVGYNANLLKYLDQQSLGVDSGGNDSLDLPMILQEIYRPAWVFGGASVPL